MEWDDCSCVSLASPGNKWAILIGIDYYIPGSQRPGMEYHRLNGCVNDVTLVKDYLGLHTDINHHRIHTLTASNPQPDSDQNAPTEPPEKRPTYSNIVGLLEHITNRAKKDDLVYIHFAGHGAQVKSIYTELKREGGNLDKSLISKKETISANEEEFLDEALVPTDIAVGGRYLRDVEFALRLQDMIERGLIVTVILDCCHGGGMSRGDQDSADNTIRGVHRIDVTLDDPVTFSQDQQAGLRQGLLKRERMRSAKTIDHWLLGTGWQSFVFFAACGATETAREHNFNGTTQGLFTYHLINTLKKYPQHTYKQINDILSIVLGTRQHAVLGGEENRIFFRQEKTVVFHTAIVTQIPPGDLDTGSRIVLNAGKIHGVSNDDMFDIWPQSSTELDESTRLGRVSVTDAYETRSEVVLTQKPCYGSIKSGCLAVPVPSRQICLLPSTTPTSEKDSIKEALAKHGVAITTAHGEKKDYIVKISHNQYQVLDKEGNRFKNEIPLLKSPEILGLALEHISKYHKILHLKDETTEDRLSISLQSGQVDSSSSPRRYRITNDIPSNPVNCDGGLYHVSHNNWYFLRIVNETSSALNIVVFMLEPSWKAFQLHPGQEGITYEVLGPNELIDIPIQMEIPDDAHDAARGVVDIIKSMREIRSWYPEPSFRRMINIEELKHQLRIQQLAISIGSGS
ncbi:caspase domain-containing protein [Camillea tinctor]|nr:caspase domain-containing protein [Camillea tinctor]